MTRINTNVSSLVAQTNLARSNTKLQEALTRLSTGLRINSGKDDPSGLIASENLRADIVSVQAAIGNSERANQIIATTESALGQVSSLLNDIRGLVTEAANAGALSDEQIAANQLQVDSSLEALNRISQTTSFQGRRLLDGSLDFITNAGGVATLESVQIDQANLGTAGQINVDVQISQAAQQATLSNTLAEAVTGSAATGSLTLTAETSGNQPTINTVNFSGGGQLTLTSGSDADQTISSVVLQQGTTDAATFGSGTLTITADFAAGAVTASDLAAIVDADLGTGGSGNFATVTGNGTAVSGPVSTTVEVTFDVGGDAAVLTLVTDNPGDIDITDVVLTDNASESATFASGVLTINANFNSGTLTAAELAIVVNNGAAGATFTASGDGSDVAEADTGSENINETVTGSTAATSTITKTQTGSAGATGSETIEITSTTNVADTRTVTITEGSSIGSTPTVAFDGSGPNITITVDDTSDTNLSAIVSAFNAFATANSLDLSAAVGTAFTGDGIYDASAETSDVSIGLSGGVADTGGLLADLVFELSGVRGAEVFTFETGASAAQIKAAVDLVSDATGVSATIASSGGSDTLSFTSTDYGTSAFINVNVLSEGTGGTFESGLGGTFRSEGRNVQASINGITATGNGNKLSINTATLDLTLSVTAGSNTDFNFDITGGGALFQLGPDVVSNQQARLGVGSVNTARLGGVSGKLYELAAGGAAALANDPNAAANIVEEAIDQITSLRGRLGAFQKTILETNIASLNDTLVNLSDAESAIRDADFAVETAKLTRAQILVQSGSSVLAIANSNPQNVLALLR